MFLFVSFNTTNAAENISVAALDSSKVSFDIKMFEIGKITGTEKTSFSFEPTNIKNSQEINHWKIRVYCTDPITITMSSLIENLCGKAVRMENSVINKFSLALLNQTQNTVGFSFKLKAYNKEGKWLHTEKQSLQWK